MLCRRCVVSPFLLFVFILSSCVPSSVPVDANVKQDVVISSHCRRSGYEPYLAENDEYCFSHPLGYYQDEKSQPDAVTLRSSEDIADFINPAVPLEGLPTPSQSVILLIHYETINGSDSLDAFITRDTQSRSQEQVERIPWFLGEEEAWLVKITQGSLISYVIYAKHNTRYYRLEFTSASSLSDQNTCATKLEKLFFTVAGTFTFLK